MQMRMRSQRRRVSEVAMTDVNGSPDFGAPKASVSNSNKQSSKYRTPKTGRPSPKTPRNPNGYSSTDLALKPKRPPIRYSVEAANYVVTHIQNGGHISKLIEEGVISCNANLHDWMKYDPNLADAVARAQETRAELWADQLIEIADGEGDPNDKRVRIDARWKVIGSLLYRRYGVKQSLDINQNINVAVEYAGQLMKLAHKGEEAKVIESVSYTRTDKDKE